MDRAVVRAGGQCRIAYDMRRASTCRGASSHLHTGLKYCPGNSLGTAKVDHAAIMAQRKTCEVR